MQSNLNDKKLAFIDAYFKEQSIDSICNKLKISRQTYYNYLKDNDIKNEINSIRYNILNDTAKTLQSNLHKCSLELINIITSDDTPPQIKINAINSVFSNCYKLTEQLDIINTIDDIEQRLSEQEINNNGGV